MDLGMNMKRYRNGIFDSIRVPGFLFVFLGALALLSGAAGSVLAQPATADLVIEEISPGNFVHYGVHDDRSPENLGDNANIGFIVGERCVLVIDTGGSLPVGLALRQAVRSVTDKPVCHVVLTHVHPDHIFGAAAFSPVGGQAEADVDVIGHSVIQGGV